MAIRPSIMNGPANGTTRQGPTQPARMSIRPGRRVDADHVARVEISVIGITTAFTSSWRLTSEPAAAYSAA